MSAALHFSNIFGLRGLFNIQQSTLNFQLSTYDFRRSVLFFSAVFMLVKKIFINSSVSLMSSSTLSGGLINGTAWISLRQRKDSLSSLRQIDILWTKSLIDSAACASP
jgi:hypothetical protein